jgi:hypothetical protein
MNQLDEVVIRRYNNINAVSLGLFQQTKIIYASRKKLRTAGDFSP